MIAGVLFNNRRHADERNVAMAPSVNRWASGTHALSPLKTLAQLVAFVMGKVHDSQISQLRICIYIQTLAAAAYRIKNRDCAPNHMLSELVVS